MTPSFPVPAVEGAYRRSYFAHVFGHIDVLLQYPRLLREIAPSRYDKLKKKTPRACWLAVHDEVRERFPIWDWMAYEETKAGSNDYFGDDIPFEVFGIDPYEDNCTSPAISLTMLYDLQAGFQRRADSYDGSRLPALECLGPFEDQLPHWLGEAIRLSPHAYLTPARGREWVKPWHWLHDLFVRSTRCADNPFLDLTDLSQQEMEAFPSWNVNELDALESYWLDAKDILDHAKELAEYIDRDPNRWLPVLAGALRKDPVVLKQLSVSSKEATLAHRFTKENQREKKKKKQPQTPFVEWLQGFDSGAGL